MSEKRRFKMELKITGCDGDIVELQKVAAPIMGEDDGYGGYTVEDIFTFAYDFARACGFADKTVNEWFYPDEVEEE